MDIGKSFSYAFEDKEWLSKLGLGAVITMVPILNFAWSGYMVGVIRNVMNNVQPPLPGWDNLDKKFSDGLILFFAGLVYALPMLVVICLPLGMMVIPAIMSGDRDLEGVANAIAGATGLLFAGLLCVFVIYALILSVIYPAILVLFAREGTLASCFKFREVFDLIGKNTSAFFTAWAVSFGASLVVGFVVGAAQTILGLIPCLGWIISFVLTIGIVIYTSVIYAHLFGQFGRFAFTERQLLPSSQPG